MVTALAAIHPDQRYRRPATLPYSTGYVGVDATADLRYESLAQFEGGGIAHSHAGASCVTRHALARLGLGHVITVRHPADHIAALYCHIRRIAKTLPASLVEEVERHEEGRPVPDPVKCAETYGQDDRSSYLFFHPVIFPVDPRFFFAADSVDDAIAHMIADGYLFHALSWIVSWQLMRIRNTSAIVRYEDFLENSNDVLGKLSKKIFNSDSQETVELGRKVIADVRYEPNLDPEVYPRGSTGDRGIWERYFTPENRRLYNSVCERFIVAHPYGSLISRLYDDLFIAV